jgi:uncharacterized protein (DUF885 family)
LACVFAVVAAGSAGAHDVSPQGEGGAGAAPAAAAPARPAWIARSDANAQVLLESITQFAPEAAAQFGVEGFDDKTLDLGPRVGERSRQSLRQARTKLAALAKSETDARVRQDLDIMIETADQFISDSEIQEKLLLPYANVAQTIFFGVRGLLDDQIAAERRPAALVRLRRYTGLEAGSEPLAKLAMDRMREKLANKALLGPVQAEIERDLGNRERYVAGIAQLFQKYGIAGYEEPYATLQKQMEQYDQFLRAEVLPRARTDFRLPPELYAQALRGVGIDMPVDELTARASAAFVEIRNEMMTLAPLVAKEKGFANSDYRAVIADLKKEQLTGDAILAHYNGRIRDLEAIVRTHRIATLPQRDMRIRIASEAEAASTPAPNMRPPRLIGNTGEMGEFILPLRIPGADQDQQFDDFTFAAASWTLTAHEGRPGHEMQYAANVERGVSVARSLFAFNSTNVEGWALYAEAECKPYEPLDGQLIALQHRLLRAARAFLDPGLQAGTVTRDEAYRLLREEVCLSDAMATQEVERYMFRSPGQAPSYFCGYARLLETRIDAERALGPAFDRLAFNDFVLSQGLLPPAILRKAVREEYVPQQRAIADRKSAAR